MPPPNSYRISRVVTPAASFAVVTLAQAKAALGIDPSDTSQDAAIQAQIDAVSIAINNYCSRVFAMQGYRDQFRYITNWLMPGEPLETRQFPLGLDVAGVPLVTITEDGAVVGPTLWEADPGSGRLYRLDTSSTTVPAAWTGTTIVVDYTGGYNPIPADIQGAALQWLNARWYVLGRDPTLVREEIPDVINTMYDRTGVTLMPEGVEDLLAPYKIWFV